MKRKFLLVLFVVVVLAAAAFFGAAPWAVERALNRTRASGPYRASGRAEALHRTLLVADMHADTLLWDRDVLERSARGHVDLPRLEEGGVALQFFTAVTLTPFLADYESNDAAAPDAVTALVVAQRWPASTWRSRLRRALRQSRKLHDAAARSGGRLVVVKTARDLEEFLRRRRGGDARAVAGLLGVEGAYPLEGDARNVDTLFEAGFRMMAPTHFTDNEWGGSAHGARKGGLTEGGREVVRRMEARGMLVVLSHASAATFDDVAAVATRPLVVSHAGVRATCDNNRNLSDEQLRKVAASGGVVGIGYWEAAVCGRDARAVARAARHAADVMGVGHVALGSDFDGAVTTPFDAAGLVLVTEALLAEGFSEEEARAVMGGNVFRLLAETLPR